MDTSEQYIKMCRQATEIQHLWLSGEAPLTNTYVVHEDVGYVNTIHNVIQPFNVGDWRWLPRQDQLQEMGRNSGPYKHTDISVFNHLKGYAEFFWFNQKQLVYDTFEQFWLALIMHENYNKTWDGESWKETI